MMGLNKSSIEWCDYTANPVRGKCFHGCHYCYVTAQRKRFKTSEDVTFHPEVLEAISNHEKPSTVFVGSSHDLFGNWVDTEWQGRILCACEMAMGGRFIFLTKNPANYAPFFKPDNSFYGASIDTIDRAKATNPYTDKLDFLSIEPLLEDVAGWISWGKVRAVIIGAQTGPLAIRPELKWVNNILFYADRAGCKVFIKDNLLKLYPELPRRRELLWKINKSVDYLVNGNRNYQAYN